MKNIKFIFSSFPRPAWKYFLLAASYFLLPTFYFLLVFLSACGGGGTDIASNSDTGAIAFKLEFEKPSQSSQLQTTNYYATGDVCADYGIATVSGYVYGDSPNGLIQRASGGPWQCSEHKGTINNVQGGGGYTVRFEGANSSGTIIYRGEKTNVSVNGGQTTDVGSVAMAKAYNVTTIAGTAGSSGATDGTGTAAMFNSPEGITTDGTNLFVADTQSHTIRKLVISTGVVTTLAGTAGSSGSTNGTGTSAKFSYPIGITTDGTNLFVVDGGNWSGCKIRKIVISTGVVTTLAGSNCAAGGGGKDGTGTSATFSNPYDIATDGTSLFVVDRDDHSIRKVVISTGVVTTFAGSIGFSGSADGTGTSARFKYPEAIATDGTNLYVFDSGNGYIRKIIISTGVVTSIISLPNNANYLTSARITTDGTNLYITAGNSNIIMGVVISTGVVTTLAGYRFSGSSTDGAGPDARFNSPAGITINGTDLYVTDTNNHTIRKLY